MKNALCLQATCCLLLLASCRKALDFHHEFPNPLTSEYQVVEYHIPLYDEAYPPRFPFLFKKTYDPTGRSVSEIECSFWDAQSPSQLFLDEFYHHFKVVQRGRIICLINVQLPKSNIPDTVMKVTLNKEGRPESSWASGELNPDAMSNPAVTEYYTYNNDRVVVVRSDYAGRPAPTYVDSIYYDTYGNVTSFLGNTYQYDYSRKIKQQFYCDDFMGGDEPFYLLQYLGYFPEVNSPTHLRIHVNTTIFHDDLTNHRFDGEGRLIGYDFYEPITITWK